VKTSAKLEHSSRFDEFKKVTFTFEILRKMKILDFPEAIFWRFCEKFKKLLSHFAVSFSEMFLAWTASEDPN